MPTTPEAAHPEPHKLLQGRTSTELVSEFTEDEKDNVVHALGRLEGCLKGEVGDDFITQVWLSRTGDNFDLTRITPEALALAYSYARYLTRVLAEENIPPNII